MSLKKQFLFAITIAVVLLSSVACSTSKNTQATTDVPAQARQGQQNRQAQLAALYAKLQLSDQQQVQFETINSKYRQEMEATLASRNGNRMAMRDKMISIRERQNSEVKEILTPAQYAIYEQEMESRRAKRGNRGGRGGFPRG